MLTKKDYVWRWGDSQQKAFDTLKKAFTEAPVLTMPDMSKPFRLETDASNFATGAILSQKDDNGMYHPIAFHSKSFNDTERNWEIHDKELASIIRALLEYRHYLEGSEHELDILSDHKNLEYFTTAKHLTRRQARWALFLSRFNFSLQHRPGKLSTKPDALSRRADHFKEDSDDNKDQILLKPGYFKIASSQRGHAQVVADKPLLKKIRASMEKLDQKVIDSLEEIKKNGPRALSKGLDEWNTEDGLILYHGKVYVPKDEELRAEIVKLHHDGIAAGHPGRWKTLELVSRNYWWPSMAQFIDRYVSACDMCLRNKPILHKPYGELRPTEIPDRPFGTITCDFVGPLPDSEGYNMILVIIDRFTKLGCFLPCHDDIDAMGTSELIMENIFKRFGLVDKIISDRGSQFSANVIKEMYSALGIKVALSTAYHPQTDGQTERVNQDLETFLRIFIDYRQHDWKPLLKFAEFAYNNKAHTATQKSPFEAFQGYSPKFDINNIPNMEHPAGEERLNTIKETQEEVKAWRRIPTRFRRSNGNRRNKIP